MHTIQNEWTIDDAADAHDALDYIERLGEEAEAEAERKARNR